MEHVPFVNMVTEAISKLEKQGVLSKTPHGLCLYTQVVDDKEICCIVGHMMPNVETRKEADKDKNCSTVRALWRKGMEWTTQFDTKQIKVLTDLQMMHDDSPNIKLTFKEIISKMRTRIADYSYFLR